LTNDERARYLESGRGEVAGSERLDLIRDLLADPVTWSEPPAGVAERVAMGIGVGPVRESVSHRRRWLVPVIVSAAAVLLSVLGFSGVFQQEPVPPDAVAMMSGTGLMPGAEGTATIRDTSSGWSIRLDVEGLPPAATGTYYQGWAWNADGEGVSIGTFHLRNGAYPVTLWAGVDLVEYPWIWVTLQDEGAGTDVSDQVMMRGRIEGLADGQ